MDCLFSRVSRITNGCTWFCWKWMNNLISLRVSHAFKGWERADLPHTTWSFEVTWAAIWFLHVCKLAPTNKISWEIYPYRSNLLQAIIGNLFQNWTTRSNNSNNLPHIHQIVKMIYWCRMIWSKTCTSFITPFIWV